MSILPPRETRLRLASWLLFMESAIVISLCLFLVFKSFTATNTSDSKALLFEIIFYALSAIVIAFFGYLLRRERRVAYAPAILINLISLGISWYLYSAGLIFAGLALAIVGILLIFLVASTVDNK